MSCIPSIRSATGADKPGLMLLFNDCGLFEPGEVHLVEEMFD